MIETYTKQYWLNEIKDSAQFLESLYRTKSWETEVEFKTEKAIFVGFYAIRKLKESKLLNNEVHGLNTSLKSNRIRTDCIVNNEDHWSKKYNLGQSDDQHLNLEKLCNQFIHSKLYSPFFQPGLGCLGFYFASDNEYTKHIYYLQLIKVINIFLSVANNKHIKLDLEVNGSDISVADIEMHT